MRAPRRALGGPADRHPGADAERAHLLFDAGERRGVAVDRVRERFGYHAVHLASTIGRHRRRG